MEFELQSVGDLSCAPLTMKYLRCILHSTIVLKLTCKRQRLICHECCSNLRCDFCTPRNVSPTPRDNNKGRLARFDVVDEAMQSAYRKNQGLTRYDSEEASHTRGLLEHANVTESTWCLYTSIHKVSTKRAAPTVSSSTNSHIHLQPSPRLRLQSSQTTTAKT